MSFSGLDTQTACPQGAALILLDVLIPGLNGIEVCARTKANNTFDDIPVLMVAASNELELIELNLALKQNNLMLEQLAIFSKTGIHNRGAWKQFEWRHLLT